MWALIYNKYSSFAKTILITLLIYIGFAIPLLNFEVSSIRIVVICINIFIFIFVLKLWEYFWKIKFLQTHFCPNLTGGWGGELIAKFTLPDGSPQEKKVNVNFYIKMSFLNFIMTGVSEDNYMTSEVLSSWLRFEDNKLFLYYIYRINIKNPKETDEQSSHGTARLELIRPADDTYYFEGNYWTNRNWHKWGQTAGHITIKKLKL
jgi:hypothetical protein